MQKNEFNSNCAIARELRKYNAVIITGASSGIGRGFVEFIDQYADVKLCNLSRSFPTYLKDRKNFLNVPCDLQKDEEIISAIPKILEFIGADGESPPKILLINNSGFGAYGEFPAPSTSRNCDMVDLNVRAIVRLCGELLPVIKAGKGSVINIASTASFQPCPQLSGYAGTKSFVKTFTLGLSYELKKAGCKCLCVCPGPTSSNFFKSAGFNSPPLPSGFGHKPNDVAKATFKALAKNRTLVTVGFINTCQAILTRFIPTNLLVNLSGKVLDKIRSV
jgi:short-subunit dehydrogenase